MSGTEKYPWVPWFAKDWLCDKALALCAPATRGVWMDLLMHMHLDGRVGILEGSVDQLASLSRCVPVVMAQALTDLQTNKAADVTERNGVVTVVCRRMQRECHKRTCGNLRVQKYREKRDCNGVEPEPEPETAQRSAENGIEKPCPDDWRSMAMAEAVRCKARNPAAYAAKVLRDWKANGGPPPAPPAPAPKQPKDSLDYCEHCGVFVGRANRMESVGLVTGKRGKPKCKECGKVILVMM